jgi:hypothetical protein
MVDMNVQEIARQAGESAAAALGPEADLLASVDAAGLGQSTLEVLQRTGAVWRLRRDTARV